MKTMKSNAPRGNIFSEVLNISTPQARFDLSYINKFSCNHGYLYPFLNQEVVPGDKFNCAALANIRLQPLVTPAMQDIDVEMRYFYIPYRLVWENFEEFMTGNTMTGQPSSHVHPYIECNNDTKLDFGPGTLPDYMGLTPQISKYTGSYKQRFSALPFRAYWLVWNEYFRDENIDIAINKNTGDGANPRTMASFLGQVSLKKDYFTSCLPWAQKGSASEIVSDVFLKDNNTNLQRFMVGQSPYGRVGTSVQVNPNGLPEGATGALGILDNGGSVTAGVNLDPNGTLGTIISINELRRANAVQRFLERSAVGGNRYSEWLLAHFGVKCADSRLQRPEYLGGAKCPIVMSEVAQTSAIQLDDATAEPVEHATPQGTLAGNGKCAPLVSFNKPYFFPEYGVLLGLMYIRPKATYFQGINRKWSRMDRFDYYLPEFAYLGEQEVLKKEIFDDPSDGANEQTFGYQSRYAEYKFNSDELHGDFRSSLKFWTMPREFATRPLLSASTITASNMPYNIFAVTDANEHHYLVELYNKIDCVRPMPKLFSPRL